MNQKTRRCQIQNLIQQSLSTYHGRILMLGFLAGLLFIPRWLSILVNITLDGNSTVLLNVGFLYLGVHTLWQNRTTLAKAKPLFDDRLIGYCLILGSAAWLPFCQDSVSLQAILLAFILLGMAWSSFGAGFFGKFPLAMLMILASIYPNYVFLSNKIFRLMTGPYFLENFMAWAGGIALKMIGQSAVSQGRFLSLNEGTVEVLRACSGFDMAFTIASCSLILGLILKQNWQRILLTVTVGALLALILNIPRIVLLTFAAVYWGDASFDFWHGPWGGQIFSAIMFTVYYYIAMAIYNFKGSTS